MGRRWWWGEVGVGARGGGATVEDFTGPISGTFETAASYSRTKILGLRSRRWAVRWASGLDGVTLFFPHVRICWDRGRCLCVCGRSVFLTPFLTFCYFFLGERAFFFFFFPTSVSFPFVSAAQTCSGERREEQAVPGVPPDLLVFILLFSCWADIRTGFPG